MEQEQNMQQGGGEAPGQSPVIASVQPHMGWWIHLGLLTAYPLLIGLMGLMAAPDAEPVLPRTSEGLLVLAVMEMGMFAAVFGLAWLASRARWEQLYLKWRGGAWPVLRGLGYSIALRVVIGLLALLVLAAYALVAGMDENLIEQFRPKIEAVVDPETLRDDPAYFWLTLTLISFVVAGFREELWRAGMLAAFLVLFPRFRSFWGGMAAVAIIAVVFGLGHTPQGWAAVGMITFLGFGLGAIIVYHRSIWDAVLAHGFFNATSFLLLSWVNGIPGAG